MSHKNSNTLAAIINDLQARERVGLRKYGTTCDRKDLTPAQWRQHKYEELLDAVMYARAEMDRLDVSAMNTTELMAHKERLLAELAEVDKVLRRRAYGR